MSSCDTQRATSVSGRLVAFIAALMIALTTLFATTAVPQPAIAADDGQTNFDSWTAAAKNIEDQLATAEKDYNDGNYVQAVTDFQTARWIGYDASNFSKVVNDTISADRQKELLQQFTDLEDLAYKQDQGDAIATKIDALTVEINATAQTLDANADLANPKEVAGEMIAILDKAYKAATSGNGDEGSALVNNAYYQYYEKLGFEKNVMNAISGNRVSQVEYQFKMTRKTMRDGGSDKEIKQLVDDLKSWLAIISAVPSNFQAENASLNNWIALCRMDS